MNERQPLRRVFGQSGRTDQRGMTVLEMLVAMLMLVVFTGVVAMVMEVTLRFLGAAESGERNDSGEVSNGVLIDHHQLQLAMDQLVDVLSQPGISREWLKGEVPGRAQIAFDPDQVDPDEACPAYPAIQWGLPMPSLSLPPGYRLCLWTTTALESSQAALLVGNPDAKPGIYLLQALPERLSASTLPTRRLFCRPRPFC